MSANRLSTKQRANYSQTSSASSTPRTRQDAVSPARISRLQEKEELQHLNDRLAAYIDKVRHLEHENDRLLYQIHSSEETVKKEITNIKGIYETELSDARKLLDEVSKDKAKLQIDIGKYKGLADDLSVKLGRKERECREAEKTIANIEEELNDLTGKFNSACNDKKRLEDDNKQYRLDNMNLEKQLAMTKKQLEEEMLMRVDLENRVQSLKEDLEFKKNVHEKEISEIRTRRELAIREIDDKLHQEYEHKLEDALKDMRFHHDKQIQLARDEIEDMFQHKLADLQSNSQRESDIASTLREELYTLRSQEEEVKSRLRGVESALNAAEARIKDLENNLEREKLDKERSIRARDEEIKRLRETMSDYLHEYQELMDIKLALDMELVAYRKMLEGEEARLNLTPSSKQSSVARTSVERSQSASQNTSNRTAGGAYKETPKATPMPYLEKHHQGGTIGGKRKRNIHESFEEDHYSSHFKATRGISSQEHCDIEIAESDPDGLFVKLVNRSNKDITLTGWTLVRTAKNTHANKSSISSSPTHTNITNANKTPKMTTTTQHQNRGDNTAHEISIVDGIEANNNMDSINEKNTETHMPNTVGGELETQSVDESIVSDQTIDGTSKASLNNAKKSGNTEKMGTPVKKSAGKHSSVASDANTVVTYRITRCVLKAKGGTLTVWSSSPPRGLSELSPPPAANPPTHLVVSLPKHQAWPTGDHYSTKLYSKDGQEIAWHEAIKTVSTVKKSHAKYGGGSIMGGHNPKHFRQYVDYVEGKSINGSGTAGTPEDRCRIM